MNQILTLVDKESVKHGFIIEKTHNGGVAQGNYQCGEKVGKWSFEYPDRIEYGELQGKLKVGEWIIENREEDLQYKGCYDDKNLKTGVWRTSSNQYSEIFITRTYFRGQIVKEKNTNYVFNEPLAKSCTQQITSQINKKNTDTEDESKLSLQDSFRNVITDTTKNPKIITKLEQIQYLRWHGSYDMNNRKIGYWMATWKGEAMQRVGGEYSDDGKKLGQWREIITNYSTLAEVVEVGEYLNDVKQGVWKYIYENKELGGGVYSIEGLKNGKWIEVSENFWKYSQVTFQGEYENGQKVGRWDICYRKYKSDKFSMIGGGSYDEAGDRVKVGIWVEIMGSFNSDSKVTYRGEYKNGKKIGSWDILCKYEGKNQKIGGGSYDESGNEHKYGQWVEISNNYANISQVIYNGEYKNGKKVGKWNIWQKSEGNYERIGGGSYDESGNELKLGHWVEISNTYSNISKVTYKGEYNSGIKIGRWDIWYKYEGKNNKMYQYLQYFYHRGGGSYDESGNELKLDQWVEISDFFNNFSQITYNGEYKNDKRVGRWDIWYQQQGKNEKIGGGQYDESGNEHKFGQWVEISNNYRDISQVTYNGEYSNGIKVGQWDIYLRIGFDQPIQKIGGGQYDKVSHGIKFGKWIELNDEFMNSSQVTFHGEYRNNRKVNKWDIFFNQNGENKLIGGGLYDNKERGNLAPGKLGKWIELDHRFNECFQVTHKGEYINNKKVGRWDTYFQDNKIGGGSYNENGIKDGQWGLLKKNLLLYKLTIFIGLFKNGEKVGEWILMNVRFQGDNTMFSKIGEQTYENEKQY